MKHAYTWGAILAVVVASTTGDVLLSRAMKKVGDVGELWRRAGMLLGRCESGRSCFRFPYVRG